MFQLTTIFVDYICVAIFIICVGPSDIRLSRNRRTFAAQSTDTDRVVLSLEIDSVAQEINEALTLRLNFDETLFDLPTDTLITELNVTIIDTECKFSSYFNFRFLSRGVRDL